MFTMNSNLTLEMNFLFRKQEKMFKVMSGKYEECCSKTILCFTKKKLHIKEYRDGWQKNFGIGNE